MTRAEEAAMKTYPALEQPVFDEMYPRLLFTRNTERNAFIKGYERAEKDLSWHSVEESLPPVDEEVIALTNEMNGHKLPDASHLCFAHRPDPEVAVCYDGWNIPGVKYWMNCPDLPEEIESNRPNSSDSSLENEMINYWGRIPDDKDLIDTARHFALWQKEQMMGEWLKDRDGCFWDGVEEGKKAMKEQMMKEAVEADVNTYRDLVARKSWAEFVVEMPTNNLSDKVRIIIVKEDKK